MTLIVHAPMVRLEERRYVLDVVLSEWLGLDYDLAPADGRRVTIRLAGDAGGRQLTLPDTLLSLPAEDWLTERSIPARPVARVQVEMRSPSGRGEHATSQGRDTAEPLPILFGEPDAADRPWRTTDAGLELSIDVFGSVFWLLARCEEVVRTDRDRHGRFPAAASLAGAEGFLERPIADEYVDLLWAAMHTLWPTLARRQAPFRLRLTHDVDSPWAALGRPAREIGHALAGDLVRRRDGNLAARRLRSAWDARSGRVDRDPFNTFDFLMDVSEHHGLRSTFYFLAGNAPGEYDFRYRIGDPPVADLLRRIHSRGHDVGLHASYMSHDSAARIRMEFEALTAACAAVGFDQPAWGVRQHYLRFRNPETWRNQDLAGLEHDSTLAFADRIGFRAGTCREYPLFDLGVRRRLALRERPLVVMDATLLEYMALGLDDAASRARAVVDACRRHGGDAVVLYHNSSLPGARLKAHYRDLVADLVA
jgi:hypothetical protein